MCSGERPSSTGAWCLGSFGQKNIESHIQTWGQDFALNSLLVSRAWLSKATAFQARLSSEALGCRGSEGEQDGSQEDRRLGGALPEVMCVTQCGSGFPETQGESPERSQFPEDSALDIQRLPVCSWPPSSCRITYAWGLCSPQPSESPSRMVGEGPCFPSFTQIKNTEDLAGGGHCSLPASQARLG